jgi:hypothetical protein
MKHSKWLAAFLSALTVSSMITAETQRTVFTRENRLPDWEQFETGILFRFREYNDFFENGEIRETIPYLRYGLTRDVAVQVNLPLISVEPNNKSGQSGIGDMEVGFLIRAHEELFGYPYFIPHVSFTLPTGSKSKGLGSGDVGITLGLSYGDKMYDFISWVWDASYRVNPNSDNQFMLSASVLWHVSEQLVFLAEARYTDKSDADPDSNSVLGLGGMVYNFTDALQMGVHFGAGFTDDTDAIGQFRLSYRF